VGGGAAHSGRGTPSETRLAAAAPPTRARRLIRFPIISLSPFFRMRFPSLPDNSISRISPAAGG
jgi:hypothetical protein